MNENQKMLSEPEPLDTFEKPTIEQEMSLEQKERCLEQYLIELKKKELLAKMVYEKKKKQVKNAEKRPS